MRSARGAARKPLLKLLRNSTEVRRKFGAKTDNAQGEDKIPHSYVEITRKIFDVHNLQCAAAENIPAAIIDAVSGRRSASGPSAINPPTNDHTFSPAASQFSQAIAQMRSEPCRTVEFCRGHLVNRRGRWQTTNTIITATGTRRRHAAGTAIRSRRGRPSIPGELAGLRRFKPIRLCETGRGDAFSAAYRLRPRSEGK